MQNNLSDHIIKVKQLVATWQIDINSYHGPAAVQNSQAGPIVIEVTRVSAWFSPGPGERFLADCGPMGSSDQVR